MAGHYKISYSKNEKFQMPQCDKIIKPNGWLLPEIGDAKVPDLYIYYKSLTVGSTLYGNTYAALHFMQLHQPKELIVIETMKGLTPFIIANLFDCKIHVFSLRKNYFSHQNIILYDRLPNNEDFERLKGRHLINTLIYAIRVPSKIAYENRPIFNCAEVIRYIENFKPPASLSYFPMTNKEIFIKIIDGGEFWISPFYFLSATNGLFFHFAKPEINYTIINCKKYSDRYFYYRYCIRHRNFDHDVELCQKVREKVTNKKFLDTTLGPLPDGHNPYVVFTPIDVIKQDTSKTLEDSYAGAYFNNYFIPIYSGNFFDDILSVALAEFRSKKIIYIHDFITGMMGKYLDFVFDEKYEAFKYEGTHKKYPSYEEAAKHHDLIPFDLCDPELVKICAKYAAQILHKPKAINTELPIAIATFKIAFPGVKFNKSANSILYS